MEPLSQLLLRNAANLAGTQPVLWINPPASSLWSRLADDLPGLQLFSQDFGDWRRLAQAGADVAFGAFPDPADPPRDTFILSLPREKQRLGMMAHALSQSLAPGGRLYLAGEIKAGIKSSPRHLEPWFEQVRRVDNARHCVLFEASRPRRVDAFSLDRYWQHWPLEADGVRLEIHSLPGVFAHGALDAGTQLLLTQLSDLAPGKRFLDFGSGAGVVGAVLLSRHAETQGTLVDSSALACLASEASLAANGLEGAVLPSDGLSDVEGQFDCIVTNPPFHQRHKSVITLSPALLGPVRNFLAPGGQFVMVANRHLPYRRWLDDTFGAHRVLSEDARYHVLAARN